MDPDDETISAAIPPARIPTRRSRLALLACVPVCTASDKATLLAGRASEGESRQDTIADLFVTFEHLLTRHEAALWRCDRLEAWLLAELDLPRVRLPTPTGLQERYAADLNTIAQHVPPGRRRYRLQQVLLRRQGAWARGSNACGLTRAQEQEAALDAAVDQAAAALLATPARTLDDIRTKLIVLLIMDEPGEAFQDSSPWRDLQLLLRDLDALIGAAAAS